MPPFAMPDIKQIPDGIQIGIPFATTDVEVPIIEAAGNVGYVFGAHGPIAGAQTAFVYNFHRDQYNALVAKEPVHDRAWFEANHPDWIMYRADRRTLASDEDVRDAGQLTLDISNPAVVQYQFDSFVKPGIDRGFLRIGFDGVYIINPNKWSGVYRDGQWVQLYSGEKAGPALADAVVGWARAMREKIKMYHSSVQIDMNYTLRDEYPEAYARLLPYLDGVFDERGFTNWGKAGPSFATDEVWARIVSGMRLLREGGKLTFINGEVPVSDPGTPAATYTDLKASIRPLASTVDPAAIQWVLANYLLVKGPDFYTNVSAYFVRPDFGPGSVKQGVQDYGRYIDRPAYHAPIGTPTGDLYEQQGVYWRDYTHGVVLVNPSSSDTQSVTLSGTYRDLDGSPVESLTMQAPSGVMLLRA